MIKERIKLKVLMKKTLAIILASTVTFTGLTFSGWNTIDAYAYTQVVFANDGYAYGKTMSDSNVTLVAELASGTASTIQWQSSTSKTGTYSDINGATSLSYTFVPENDTWYRCSVNGTTTIPVALAKAGGTIIATGGITYGSSNDLWYVTNGNVAYYINDAVFDAIGRYVKDNKTYWLQTSYSGRWNTYSSTSATPSSQTNTPAQLDSVKVAFNELDAYSMKFEADLASGQQAFAFGCDTQLGNSYTSGAYNDRASLKAIVDDNNEIYMVQMVGAASVDTALPTDPSFVVKYIDGYAPSHYHLSHYSSRKTWYSDGIMTLDDTDSGFVSSWSNIASGGSVKFEFHVGAVADSGAEITATAEVTSTTIELSDLDSDYLYRLVVTGSNPVEAATEWTAPDTNGKITFTGLQQDTNYTVQAVNSSNADISGATPTVADETNIQDDVTNATTAIDPADSGTTTVDDDGNTVNVAAECTPSSTGLAFTGLNSAYTYKLLDADDNQVKPYTAPVSGAITFSGLGADTDYYLVAKSSSNVNSDKVEYTTAKAVVSYNINTTDTGTSTVPTSQEKTRGAALRLSSTIMSRPGYDFLGWSTNNASTTAQYVAGGSFTSETDTVLYSVWKPSTTVALQLLTAYADDAITTIEDLDILTDNEKTAYISTINTKKTAGEATINLAATPEQVTSELTNAENEIALVVEKANAINAIKNNATDSLTQIDGLTDLTVAQRNTVKEDINSIKSSAIIAIESAVTINAVTSIKNTSLTDMDTKVDEAETLNLSNAKSATKTTINHYANSIKDDLAENYTLLTETQLNTLISSVTTINTNGYNEIDATTTTLAIVNKQIEILNELNAITSQAAGLELSNLKASEVIEIGNYANECSDDINAISELTQVQKDAFIADVNSKKTDGIVDINVSTTRRMAEDALSDAEDTMDNVIVQAQAQALLNAKQSTKNAIDAQAAIAKTTIDAMNDLTAEEKTIYKDSIDTQASSDKAAVDAATTITNAKAKEGTDLTAIDVILEDAEENATNNLDTAKTVAKTVIDTKATTAKATIDALQNLSAEEKTTIKTAIDNQAAEDKTSVDEATSIVSANTIKSSNSTEEDALVEEAIALDELNLATAKAEVNTAINTKLTDTKAAIDALTNLSDAEKAAAKAKAEEQANEDKEAVDASTQISDITELNNNDITEEELILNEAKSLDAVNKAAKNVANTTDSLTFTGLNTNYTYQLKDEDGNVIANWTSPSSDGSIAFTDLEKGKNYSLYAKDADDIVSEGATLTTKDQEVKPTNVTVDYVNMVVNGLDSGEEYIVEGTKFIADSNGNINITTDMLGKEISIIKAGDGEIAIDSEETKVSTGNVGITSKLVTGATAKIENLYELFNKDNHASDVSKGITESELETVKSGGNIGVLLEVEESTDESQKESEVIKAIKEKDNTVEILCSEINIIKTVKDANGNIISQTKIVELPEVIDITLTLPSDYQGKDSYVVYRDHEGSVDTLTDTPNADGEYFTVKEDKLILHVKKFSTYAVSYVEKKVESANTETTAAETADTTNMTMWIILIMLSGLAVIVIRKKREELSK